MEDLGKRNLEANPGTADYTGSLRTEYHCVCPGRLTRGNGPLSCLIREGAGAPGAQVGAEGDSVRVKLGSVSVPAGCQALIPLWRGWWEPGTTPRHASSDPAPACGEMLSAAAPTKRPGGPH